MSNVYLRKYGESATIPFELFEVDGINFRVDAVYAAGDVKIMKDEGAEANTTNSFTDEGTGYSIVLTATEMQAARIVLYFVDQTATKVWLDRKIVIETYGHASAQHAFDLDTASVAQTGDAYGIVNNGTYGNSALDTDLNTLLSRLVGTIATGTHNPQSGDSYARLGAPAGASIAADLVVIDNFVDELESRLTAIRAGYLDNLNGHIPQTGDNYLGATAKANLIAQYDTTGLTGDTFPATQAQIGNLAVGSAALGANVSGIVVTSGIETLTYTATHAADGILHEVAPSAGTTDFYYTVTLPGNGFVTSIKWRGYVQSNADTVELQFYNWTTMAFVTEKVLIGANGTTLIDETVSAINAYTGTGADAGKVRFRFLSTTATNITTDRFIFEYTTNNQSVGYADGAIWYDDSLSNTDTEAYIDGTADNPVSTWAAVLTLIAATGLKRVRVGNGSAVVLTANSDGYTLVGREWSLDLNGQSIASAHFEGAETVTGIGTGATQPDFLRCIFNTCTLPPFHASQCGLAGTITLGSPGNYVLSLCHSAVAGSSTPIIDTGAAIANVNLTMPGYQNGIEIRNLNTAGTDLFSISGIGQIIYAASSSGAVNQRGLWKVTNTGGVTITKDDNSVDSAAAANLFITQLIESYAADGVAPTPAQALMLIQQVLTDFAIVSTTNTIKKLDGTTTAAVLTLDSASAPTSSTRTS